MMGNPWRDHMIAAWPRAGVQALSFRAVSSVMRLPTDLASILWPAFWLFVGLLLSTFYLFGAALVPAPFSDNLPEPLYPPEAIVLAALLLTPARRWWLLLIEAYVFEVVVFLWMGYRPLPTLLGHGANLIEPLVGALLVRRFMPTPPRFDTVRQVSLYTVSVSVASAVGATLGAATLLLAGRPYLPSWQAWFLGDVLANLLLAPTIMLWIHSPARALRTRSRWRTCETVALCCALVVTCLLVFEIRAGDPEVAPALFFLPIPTLMWAAVRFGPRGIASALCLVTVFAIPGVAHGLGPFVASSTAVNLLMLQLFLITIGIPLFCVAALVRERERAQGRLEQSEERYRTVVRNLPRAVVLLFGSDRRHLFADGQELERLGLERVSAEGKTLAEAFPTDVAAALAPGYQAALAGANASFDLVHAGRRYEGHALPINDAETIAGMVVLQEVTEERRAKELAALEDARTAFFNHVSYELRTPLTLVLAPLQEVLSLPPEGMAPEIHQALQIAQDNATRLLKLVNALVDLSRLASGRVRSTYTPTNLGTYTADLASTFRSAVEQAGLRLVVKCPALPELVYVDREQWEQIVFNLLSNALRLTAAGEIVVTVGLREKRAVLRVHDTGVGVPAEELPHLFEPFRRVHSAPVRTDEGTSVGLALVHELVKLQGGTVNVRSSPGRGSTFVVTIPRGSAHLPVDQIGEPPDRSPVPAEMSVLEPERVNGNDHGAAAELAAPLDRNGDSSDRTARLLVVDDDPVLGTYIAHLLAGRGTIRTAGGGSMALEIARSWQPDLMLVDVRMPGVDGLELLSAIRADPHLRSISVILLSAWVDDELRTRGLRAGADDFVTKPFTIADLLARVDGQLRLARMRSEAWTAAERERLALDLHDSVTQSVYGLTLLAEAVRRVASRGDHRAVDEYLGRLSETSQRALREMRLLVSQLRPSSLSDLGLVQALELRLNTVERRAGLTARLVVNGEIALTSQVEREFYFIAQEALNNALKHAAATVVVVRISGRPHSTELVVADNGRGFDVDDVAGGGIGLVSIQERAARIGASVTIGRRRRGGTQVTVSLRADAPRPSDVVPTPPDSRTPEERGWTVRSAS
jgi:signal transduction histidine kinase/integral membrane sensor domain MASE1